MIPVPDPLLQNIAFFIALAVCVFLFRVKNTDGVLGRESTMSLKGFAILAVLFAHIGSQLQSDLYALGLILISNHTDFQTPLERSVLNFVLLHDCDIYALQQGTFFLKTHSSHFLDYNLYV